MICGFISHSFIFFLVPKTLDIPSPSVTKTRRKKKRRRRSNETVVKFTDIYQLGDEILGSGARSTVVTCIKRQSGSEYAVKVCPLHFLWL